MTRIATIHGLPPFTFRHGFQVECDFRALAEDRKKLTSGIQPAQQLAATG